MKLTEDTKNEIIKLRKEGFSYNKIAKQLKIAKSSVQYWASDVFRENRKNNKTYKEKRRLWYKKWYPKHRKERLEYLSQDRFKKYRNERLKNIRIKALKIVGKGNMVCGNCGCTDVRVLEINHINGGGRQEVGKNTIKFYSDIIKGNRKTDDLNILCKVCNFAYFVERKYDLKYSIILNSILNTSKN